MVRDTIATLPRRAPGRGIDAAEVRRVFTAAHSKALAQGRPVLAVWTRPRPGLDPRGLIARADRHSHVAGPDRPSVIAGPDRPSVVAGPDRPSATAGARVFYWASRWTGMEILGVGTSLDLAPAGDDRFTAVGLAWREHAEGLVAGGSGLAAQPGFPLLTGGFAFQRDRWHPSGGPPEALMWCPAVQVVRIADGSTHLALSGLVTPETDPVALADERVRTANQLLAPQRVHATAVAPRNPDDPDDPRRIVRFDLPDANQWRVMVDAALRAIRRGEFTKVVLARQIVLHADQPFSIATAVDRLASGFAEGAVFAAKFDGGWFLGGTPECLVRSARGRVVAHSLAGSVARGSNPAGDADRARELVDGVKTRHEQGVVTDFVTRTLASAGVDVVAPADDPQVLRLGNLQHLVSTVTATVPSQSGIGLLDLVDRLHPTPAVGGYPREEALRWIARSEPFDRGWYAAPIGWLDAAQDGEMAVAIRSALVKGARAALYAGCGLVDGSVPDDEYAETELKLRPMLTALGVQPAALGVQPGALGVQPAALGVQPGALGVQPGAFSGQPGARLADAA